MNKLFFLLINIGSIYSISAMELENNSFVKSSKGIKKFQLPLSTFHSNPKAQLNPTFSCPKEFAKKRPSTTSFVNLPREIKFEIVSELVNQSKEISDLFAFSLVCKKFHTLYKETLNQEGTLKHFKGNISKRSQIEEPIIYTAIRLKANDWLKQNIDQLGINRITRLAYAAKYNSCKAIELLLNLHNNDSPYKLFYVNQKGNEGKPALHYASKYNATQALTVLLKNGALVNDTDSQGRTALHVAASNYAYQAAALLLANHAYVDAENIKDQTPLHAATSNKETGATDVNSKVIQLLLDNNCSLNTKDILGRTPLHMATWFQNENTVALLLKNGARIDLKNKDGVTPLQIATVFDDKVSILHLLLAHVANVDAQDSDGSTLLHLAARANADKSTAVLLEHGAYIDKKNHTGETPLHNAAKYHCAKTVKALLIKGADKTIKDNNEKIALDRAIAATTPGLPTREGQEIIAMLS